jgi:hypothetical protein
MKIKPADSRQWYADSGDSTLRQQYDLNENSIVFDIGASVGDWRYSFVWENWQRNVVL